MTRPPLTLVVGLTLIAACEALLAVDVHDRGGLIMGHDVMTLSQLPRPQTPLQRAARLAAVNMTPLCWLGYLLSFDGLLAWLARRRGEPALASLRARPNRFLVAWLTSVPMWCWFDWINFRFMDAWRYFGMPPHFSQRVVGYFIAFAAISPGMFLAAQFYQALGLRRLPRQPVRIPGWVQGLVMGLGVLFVLYPFLVTDAIACLTLWVSLIFLLDPICYWLKLPSLIGDWQAGRWGRTLALMAGGATCGFLWEFWNYWALSKWTYHLPFLGSLEHYRYFEMPWLGFLGFLPFAIECWLALNLIIYGLDRVGLKVAEPLPDANAIF